MRAAEWVLKGVRKKEKPEWLLFGGLKVSHKGHEYLLAKESTKGVHGRLLTERPDITCLQEGPQEYYSHESPTTRKRPITNNIGGALMLTRPRSHNRVPRSSTHKESS
jgi:hypothetical protein